MLPVLLCFVLIGTPLHSSPPVSSFGKLSGPEKCWVMLHPFVSSYAHKCALRARAATDSLQQTGDLTDPNGGQLDAFRHAYWMALLVQKMPARKALSLGKAHEKGNYLDWKKGKLEDGARPDSMACEMDLKNNEAGVRVGLRHKEEMQTSLTLLQRVIMAVWDGSLFILNKDADGNYLNCSNEILEMDRYRDSWYIPKCIVSSDNIVVPH